MAFLDKRNEEAQAPSRDAISHSRRATSSTTSAERATPREHNTRTLLALQALTDTALSNLSLDAMLPELLERLRAVMQVDNAAILLMDEETNELVVRMASGPEEEVVGKARIPFAEGFAGRIAATRQPLFVEDLSTYPVKNPLLRERLHSVLGVPLIAEDRVLGVVHIGAAGRRQFTAEDEALLTQAADRIARAVERAQLYAEAKEARRLAEQRASFLNTTLESLGDGLVITDPQGDILYANPAYSELMGEGVEGAAFLSGNVPSRMRSLDPRDANGVPLSISELGVSRALRGETLAGPTALEVRIRRLDGRQATLSVTGGPVRDADGVIIGAVMALRDVTERWLLNERLQERTAAQEAANLRLRTLLDVLPVAVAITNAPGALLEVNPAFYRIWGSDAPMPAEVTQYSAYRGWRVATGEPLRPEDWPLSRTLATGETVPGEEIEIETFSGGRKFALMTAAPQRDASGAVTGGIVAMLDITDQKRRTERTRAALEGFIAITQTLVDPPDGSSAQAEPEADDEEHGQRRSTAARRIAELTREVLGCSRVSISAVEGEDLRQYPVTIVGLSPELERTWWEEQRAQSGAPVGAGATPEDRERLLAGEIVTFDLTRPPYLYPNAYGVTSVLSAPMRIGGRIVGMLGLDFQDPGDHPHVFTPEEVQITDAIARLGAVVLERERLLREREVAHAQTLALTEANRRMDEFLGIAGHELRTPLTTLKLNLQLADRRARAALKGGQVEPSPSGADRATLTQVLRLLERAEISVRRQERLVQDLLDVSRISAGKLEFRMSRHDLRDITREVVEEQRLGATNRRIELSLPERAVSVTADTDRIGQVLTNFLTNALKYSQAERPVKVNLQVRGTRARVEVQDKGPGLTLAQRRQLFERFHRVEGIEVVSGSGVGLGLGLYISKTIVEHHGGSIGVTSAPGKGSTFWFELPLAEDDGEGEEA